MQEKPKILIRADGGANIGMGHIVRTSVLAAELSKLFGVAYICLQSYQEGIAYIEQKGYQVIACCKEKLFDVLVTSDAIGIITDSYAIDAEYIKNVRKYFRLVGYIDDNGEREFDADFIINQNFGAQSIDYNTNRNCKCLLGSQYVLLKDAYMMAQPITIKKHVREILITVGGSDNYNYTKKILDKIKYLNYQFNVVIGPIFPHEKDLYQEYENYNCIRFYKQPNMYELMQKCDIAISSCGSTLYELGALGIPTIGVAVADNQIPLAKRMYAVGAIDYLGDIRESSLETLDETLLALVSNYKKRQKIKIQNTKYINKNGVKVVAEVIMTLTKEKGLINNEKYLYKER